MRRRTLSGLDVYLLPAVVGGGLGDIEEVLLAGRRLTRAGFRVHLYRPPDRPAVRSLDGPWGWPRLERPSVLAPAAPRALTISAWWGVSAGPAHEGPYGRAGPWARECAEIVAAYPPGQVLHVSFEEFARTLTAREQTGERWREGGVALRTIRARQRTPAARREITEFDLAYRKFRAFDRPEVLHLYPTFRPSRAFGRAYPEAVQTGPFWPEPLPRVRRRDPDRWVWYASPGSSPRLAERLARGLPPAGRTLTIELRSPTAFVPPERPGLAWRQLRPEPPSRWRRRWASAGVRLATGSRTLLEALAAGGPFLYFNGVLGRGASARRHRPEKIDALLRLYRRAGVDRRLVRDLSDFSRLRGVERVLRAARTDPAWARRFKSLPSPGATGFRPPYGDAGQLLEELARAWARGGRSAAEMVSEVRSGRFGAGGRSAA
jgi:hypothetical protein